MKTKPVRECLLVEDRLKSAGQRSRSEQTPKVSLGTRLKARAAGAKSASMVPSAVALLGALIIFYFVEVRARTDQASLTVPERAGAEQVSEDQAVTPGRASLENGQHVDVKTAAGSAGLSVLGELAPRPSSETPTGTTTVAPAEPRLRITARERSWVRVSIGENTLFSGMLRSDETRSFSLRQPLSVKLGNPLGTRLWVNDQAFSQLGEAGKTKTIVVSAENYPSFLAARDPIAPSPGSSRASTLN